MVRNALVVLFFLPYFVRSTTVEEFLSSPAGIAEMEKIAIIAEPKTDVLQGASNLRAENIVEGDIDLGDQSLAEYLGVEKQEHAKSGRLRHPISGSYRRWPHRTVYYTVADRHYNRIEIATIAAGIKHVQDRTCIKIKERTSKNQRNYVRIHRGKYCRSAIGMHGRMQNMSIGSRCLSVGIVAHEFMHAIGFFHEQSRMDRNDYVEILWNNIIPSKDIKSNFWQRKHHEIIRLGMPYDYRSLMHYEADAFKKREFDDSLFTIVPGKKFKKGTVYGQRKGLSRTDIMKINKLYRCPTPANVRSTPLFLCDRRPGAARDLTSCRQRAARGDCRNWKTYKFMAYNCNCACTAQGRRGSRRG